MSTAARLRGIPLSRRSIVAALSILLVLIAVGATVAVLAIVAVSFHRYQQDNLRADLTTAGQSVAAAVDNMATMGDTSPGAAMKAFLNACEELVELRDRELAGRAARLAGEPQ